MLVIDVFDIWQKLMSLVNVQQGGNVRPQVDFQNWYNSVSSELFHEKGAKIGLGQQIEDEMSPFYRQVNIPVTTLVGMPYDKLVLPADYEYFLNASIVKQKDEKRCFLKEGLPIIDGNGKCRDYVDPDYAEMRAMYAGQNLITKTVVKVDADRWPSCLEHRTKGPTYENPKISQINGGLYVAPKGIQSVILKYYKTPTPAVFAYTIGSGDQIVYNPGGSTQLEWSGVLENEFLTRLVKKYGAYVRENGIYQMANEDKKQLV